MSSASLVARAVTVIHTAWKTGPINGALGPQAANALNDAGLLMDPAELEHLRTERDAFRDQRNAVFKTNEQLLAEIQQEQEARLLAENETRTVARSLGEMTGRATRAEQRRAELEAVLGTHRDDDRAELERLRARVAELEAAGLIDEQQPVPFVLTEEAEAEARRSANVLRAMLRREWCTGCNTDHAPADCGYRPGGDEAPHAARTAEAGERP